MKKWVQLMSVAVLMPSIIATPVSVVASSQPAQVKVDAAKNATELIIKQGERPSKASIAKLGPEYAEDFWTQYRQLSEQYWLAYRQGIDDVHQQNQDWRVPDDKVKAAGYQAGRSDAMLGINKLFDQKENDQAKQSDSDQQRQVTSPENTQDQTIYQNDPHDKAEKSFIVPTIDQPVSNDSETSDSAAGDDKQAEAPTPKSREEQSLVEIPPIVVGATGKAFIKKMAPLAQEVGRDYDLYPSVMLAQAALESNWGQSELANRHHNLFGVKATDGLPSVLMPTTECDASGKAHDEKAKFRKYQSNKESLLDYANTLSDPLYNGAHRKQAHSWKQATAALNGKYATDPHYSAKLNAIIRGGHLDRYDKLPKQHQSSHHWGTFADKPINHHEKTQSTQASHDHTDLATIGILGGAGSFSLFGFFRHLFGT